MVSALQVSRKSVEQVLPLKPSEVQALAVAQFHMHTKSSGPVAQLDRAAPS